MSFNFNIILLVDDDAQALDSTRKILELAKYQVVTAKDGQQALDLIREPQAKFDLVLTDVRMPRLGGLEFLRALSLCGNKTPVVLMTAFGRVEDAVWAMKLGAVDFLTKPFKRQALLQLVEATLRRTAKATPDTGDIRLVGTSAAMSSLTSAIQQIAPTQATVLITGESGTGKELVAKLLHHQSPRAQAPFVALNCAAIPESLIEAELFGHEKGAFTGASSAKMGLFEAANGGTLLLDEIGDMPFALQAKLLRVLQEGEIRRIGATASRKVDVRLVAATHQDLKQRVLEGKFRQDLLYRLQVIELTVPPLRDRIEDVDALADFFFAQSRERHQKTIHAISQSAKKALLSHSWPGNIRELSNVIERAIVLTRSEEIQVDDLPDHIRQLASQPMPQMFDKGSIAVPFGTSLRDVEDLLIRKTLEATSGDKNMTAKLLGINSRTIYRKLDKDRETS